MAGLSKTVLASLERQREEASIKGDIKRAKYFQKQIDNLKKVMERAK